MHTLRTLRAGENFARPRPILLKGRALTRFYRAFAYDVNGLATATAAILVHNENLLRLCTKMAAVSMAKGCMQTLY